MGGGGTAACGLVMRGGRGGGDEDQAQEEQRQESLTSHHCHCHCRESHRGCCLCRDLSSGLLRPKRSWMASLGQPLFVCVLGRV